MKRSFPSLPILCCVFFWALACAQDPPPEALQPPEPAESTPDEDGSTPKAAGAAEPGETHFNYSAEDKANRRNDFHTDLYTGQFTFRLPFRVIPSRQNSEPQIALVYNSSVRNGPCGVGWSLDLASISRDTRRGVPVKWNSTYATNELAYEDEKGFTVDIGGTRGTLVRINTGQPAEFVAQNNSGFLRFLWYRTGAEPYWEVIDKNGSHYFLGLTAQSRIENPDWPSATRADATCAWFVSRIRDRNGNETTFMYIKDSGHVYPAQIDYGTNANLATSQSSNHIILEYDFLRPDRPMSMRFGFADTVLLRMTNVMVTRGVQQVRRYGFRYDNSPSSSKTLLKIVTEIGTNNVDSLPPISFEYNEMLNTFSLPVGWGGISGARLNHITDVDGDALPDLLFLGNKNAAGEYTTYRVQFNNGSGWAPITEIGPVQSLKPKNSNWSRMQYTTNDLAIVQDPYNYHEYTEVITEDVDGDGYSDRVEFNKATGSYRIQRGTGVRSASAAFQSAVTWATVGLGADKRFQYWWHGSWTVEGFAPQQRVIRIGRLADLDGDGLPDRIVSGISRWSVWPGGFPGFTGGYFWPGVQNLNIYHDAYGTDLMLDLNGDGLLDRYLNDELFDDPHFTRPRVQWNNGHGFEAYVPMGNREYTSLGLKLIDFNGDGLPDFHTTATESNPSTRQVKINSGTDFTTNVNFSTPEVIGVANEINFKTWIDVNGDGLVDHVTFSNGSPSLIYVSTNSGPMPDLLKHINNGVSGKVDIIYVPSTRWDNGDGTRHSLLPYIVWTVASVKTDDGFGTVGETTYNYSGGMNDPGTREFRGFHAAVQNDPSGIVTKTYFHQGGGVDEPALGEYQDPASIAKKGMPYRIETIGSDGLRYHLKINKVEELVQSGSAFAYVAQTIDMDYEGTGNYRAKAARFVYDTSTGNLTNASSLGEVTNISLTAQDHSLTILGPQLFTHTAYTNIGDVRSQPAWVKITSDIEGAAANRLRETRTGYDERGNLTDTKVWHNDFFASIGHNTYDAYGNVTNVIDAKGVITAIEYDATTKTYPIKTTIPPGVAPIVNQFVYDPRSGQVALSVDNKGFVVSNCFDLFLRPVETRISSTPNGQASVWKSSTTYSSGGIVSGDSQNFTRHQMNDGSDVYEYQDGVGRVIQTRTQSERSGKCRVVDTVYEDNGRVLFTTQPYFEDGTTFTHLSGTHTCKSFSYDAIGRVQRTTNDIRISFPSGGSTTFGDASGDVGSASGIETIEYKDGNNLWVTVSTDPENNKHKKYFKDALGRTWQIQEENGAAVYETKYGYDLLGQLTRITNHAQNVTSIEYDTLGNRTKLIDPDAGEWNYLYDAAGRLLSQSDPRGNLIDTFYDDFLGRLTVKSVFNAHTTPPTLVNYTSYSYDYPYDGFMVYVGQLSYISDLYYTESYGYDFRGRVTDKQTSGEDGSVAFHYTYDDADRQQEITYPNNWHKVRYNYDVAGNMNRVDLLAGNPAPANGILYQVSTFDELGQPESISHGNGLVTTKIYYPFTKRLQTTRSTKAGGGYQQDLTYTYDRVGNIKSITDNADGHAGATSANLSSIEYDDLHRLTRYVRNDHATNFSYDALGNFLVNEELSTSTYQYQGWPHAVTQAAPGKTYNYDEAGNMRYRPGVYLQYDEQNRLVQIDNASTGTNATFAYTDSGALFLQRDDVGLVQHCWVDGMYEREYSRVWYHVLAGGTRIATFNAQGSIAIYYDQDAIGSTKLVTDKDGTHPAQYEYSAYGGSTFAASSNGWLSSSARFTGQRLLWELGLYWYGSRFYDAEIGRFIQPDTIVPSPSDPQTLNRYAYCLNNPLKYCDPTGHSPAGYASGWGGAGWDAYVNIWNFAFSDVRAAFVDLFDPIAANRIRNDREPTGVSWFHDQYWSGNADFRNSWQLGYQHANVVGEYAAVFGPAAVSRFSRLSRAGQAYASALLAANEEWHGLQAVSSTTARTGVNANRIAHARAVEDFISHVRANGLEVVGTEVTFKTPFGARRLDVVLRDPRTKLLGGVELKSSLRAFNRFDAAARQQFSADRWINQFGAEAVGEFRGLQIDNTIKILWPAPTP